MPLSPEQTLPRQTPQYRMDGTIPYVTPSYIGTPGNVQPRTTSAAPLTPLAPRCARLSRWMLAVHDFASRQLRRIGDLRLMLATWRDGESK